MTNSRDENAPLAIANPETWFLRLFVNCTRAMMGIISVIATVHEGVWLGLLSHRQIDKLSQFAHSQWPDLKTREHNLSGFFSWEQAALERFFQGCDNFMVSAAGAGREMIALSKDGKKAVGFDCCEEFVKAGNAILQSEGINAELTTSLPGKIPHHLLKFKAVIVGWISYGLIDGKQSRIDFLISCSTHMIPGALLLLSATSRIDDWRGRWVFRVAKVVRQLRSPPHQVQYGDRLILDASRSHFTHQFSREEVELELNAAGFKIEFYEEMPLLHCVARYPGSEAT